MTNLCRVAAVLLLYGACGAAHAPAAPSPSATPSQEPAADPIVTMSCPDRLARARTHLESVGAEANRTLAEPFGTKEHVGVEKVDGTARDPKAVVIRYVASGHGPSMVVGDAPAVAWDGKATVPAVMDLVRKHTGAKIVELELGPHLDASGLDALLVELATWGQLRMVAVYSKLDPDRVVLPDTPAWAKTVIAAPREQRAQRLRDAMTRAAAGCAQLHDAFGAIAGAQDIVTKLAAALDACGCETANPEAVGTLAAMTIAVGEWDVGWLELRALGTGGTQVVVTKDPRFAALTTDEVVHALAKLPIAQRRAGITLELGE